MSELNPISVHPDSKAQKQQIRSQARKHDESVSEYCLKAIEYRLAREMESERLDELEIEPRLEDLKTSITQEIAAAMDTSTHQELCYEVAVWKLLGNDYSRESRHQAMKGAPDLLEKDLERMAEKEGGED